MEERLVITRRTKIEYACGCTTTRIEAIRISGTDIPICEGHRAAATRLIEETQYPSLAEKYLDPLPSSNDLVVA